MKSLEVIMIVLFALLLAPSEAAAGGPFGPPEPIVKGARGLHTGIGLWFHQDKHTNGMELVTRQNQIYSELGYGVRNRWEITARIGMSDLKMSDAFSPTTGATTTSKRDFEDNGKYFGTLGAKGYYPLSGRFGVGAFVQGTYSFSDFTDDVSGTRSGIPFSTGVRVKNLWDLNLGMSLQVAVPGDAKIYAGPYFHHSELKVSPSGKIAALSVTSGETVMKNKTDTGGFAGIEVPLAKGFRLNLEGQYTERLSAGAAVIYVY